MVLEKPFVVAVVAKSWATPIKNKKFKQFMFCLQNERPNQPFQPLCCQARVLTQARQHLCSAQRWLQAHCKQHTFYASLLRVMGAEVWQVHSPQPDVLGKGQGLSKAEPVKQEAKEIALWKWSALGWNAIGEVVQQVGGSSRATHGAVAPTHPTGRLCTRGIPTAKGSAWWCRIKTSWLSSQKGLQKFVGVH